MAVGTGGGLDGQPEYRSLQRFFRWLFEEGDISVNPFDRMCPPMIEQRQCRTSPETGFEDRRDKALFTMLVDTDARLCEIAGLGVDDIDWDLGVAVVVGKGKGQRTLPMSPTTIKELDRCVFKPAVATATPIRSGCGGADEEG